MEKKNKFISNLTASNKEIKEQRAKFIAEDAQEAFNVLITSKQKEIRDLEKELMNLEDLSPTTAMSLMPTSDNFKAEEWVKKLTDTKIQLKISKEELQIIKETYSEYFE